uniref:Uncharacterized protein n=1 Tax=Pristionchus pacificus TaxID=54126 RepID=A0A2A6BQP9_PRIPA
ISHYKIHQEVPEDFIVVMEKLFHKYAPEKLRFKGQSRDIEWSVKLAQVPEDNDFETIAIEKEFESTPNYKRYVMKKKERICTTVLSIDSGNCPDVAILFRTD